MLSKSALEAFYLGGYICLPGVVAGEDLERMQASVWTLLEARGVVRDKPSTWCDADHPPNDGVKYVMKLQALRAGDSSPERFVDIREVLDQVFSAPRGSAKNWG